MISLDSRAWEKLRHAYGSADDIPDLIRLVTTPDAETKETVDKAWFDLWGSLCHQRDIYTASIAAVPHLILAGLQCHIRNLRDDHIFLPVEIEKSRMREPNQLKPGEIPEDYWSWIVRLDELASLASEAGRKRAAREVGLLLRGRRGPKLPPQKTGTDLGELFG